MGGISSSSGLPSSCSSSRGFAFKSSVRRRHKRARSTMKMASKLAFLAVAAVLSAT